MTTDVVDKLRRSRKQNIDAKELPSVNAALDLCYPLRATILADLAPYEGRPLKSYEQSRRADLLETLRQIEEGYHPDEGTDPRLYELVSRPEITRFHFARPGIASLKRLQARLLSEQEG